METEDLACASVRYENGAIGVIEATTAFYPGSPERIDFIGTRGTASLAGTALDVQWQDGRSARIEADASPGGSGADPMAFPHDYHRSVWRDFLDSLDEDREPRVSGRDVLRVHRLIDALIAAGASGGKVAVVS
jgi:predicted dehydrogenase